MFSIQNNQLWGCALATTEHPRWNESVEGNYGINLLGINIIPNGSRYFSGAFNFMGSSSSLWSTTETSSTNALYFSMTYNYDIIYLVDLYTKMAGFGVRCLREATTTELAYYDGEIIENTYIDGDSNTYDGVKIGEQVWITTNIKTTKYQNGNNIPNVTDGATWANLTTPAYCWYNNDIGYSDSYGALYNWYTVNNGLVSGDWRVPSDNDWTELGEYVLKEYGYMGYSGSNIARILKSCRQVNHPLG